MREIKFRAWHIDSKVMFDVLAIPFQNKQIIVKWHGVERAIPMKQFELMQLTGLKDRDGVDIYEGDILKNKKSTAGNFFVKFNVGGYDAVYKNNFTLCLHPVLHYFEGAAIIGNIYQNPELLTL